VLVDVRAYLVAVIAWAFLIFVAIGLSHHIRVHTILEVDDLSVRAHMYWVSILVIHDRLFIAIVHVHLGI
jgi:hypothetical protein